MILNYKYRIKKPNTIVLDRFIYEYNQAYNTGLNLIQKAGKHMHNNGMKSNDIFNILYTKVKSALKNRNITNTALIQDGLRHAYNTLFINIKKGKPFDLHFKDSSSLEGSFPFRTNKIPNKVFKQKIEIIKHRDIPQGYRVLGSRIKRENNKYYIILTITDDQKKPKLSQDLTEDDFVGIDSNQNNYTFSNGYKIEFLNKIYPELEKKRLFHQKNLSNKRKKSNNRKKEQKKLFNISRKIKNRRLDSQHKMVTQIIAEVPKTVYVVEKLNITKMTKNLKNNNKQMRKNMLHIAHSQFFSILDYKSMLNDRFVLSVDPAYTSMTCSRCGSIKKMELSQRTYQCESCGLQIDRDLNASINIKRLGSRHYC